MLKKQVSTVYGLTVHLAYKVVVPVGVKVELSALPVRASFVNQPPKVLPVFVGTGRVMAVPPKTNGDDTVPFPPVAPS